MQDQRDDRQHEQKVDQASSNVKYREPSEPCDQKNDKKDGPDTHSASSRFRSTRASPRTFVSWLIPAYAFCCQQQSGQYRNCRDICLGFALSGRIEAQRVESANDLYPAKLTVEWGLQLSRLAG